SGDERRDSPLLRDVAKERDRLAHRRPVAIRRQELLLDVGMRQWGGGGQTDAAAAFRPHEYDPAGKTVGEAVLQRQIRRRAERARDKEELRIGRRFAAIGFSGSDNSAGKIGRKTGPEQIAGGQFHSQGIQRMLRWTGPGELRAYRMSAAAWSWRFCPTPASATLTPMSCRASSSAGPIPDN